MSAIAQFAEGNTVRQFFEGDRFIHIYGKVREDATAPPPSFDLDLLGGVTFGGAKPQPGPPQLWNSNNALFDTVDSVVETARRAIADANCVYILGYGFDENNSKLLLLPDSLALTKDT